MLSMSISYLTLNFLIFCMLVAGSTSGQFNLIENIDPNKFYASIYGQFFNISSFEYRETSASPSATHTSSPDGEEPVYFLPTPPIVGQKPDLVTINEPIYSNRGPQPFTIFMNFQDDGTTSLQILSQQNLYWSDIGNCRHGQMFDPAIGICRDVFCVEGYILGPNGCMQDANFNKTEYSEPIKKPPPQMNIQITLIHKLCVFYHGQNDTKSCDHRKVMTPRDSLLKALKNSFAKVLHINASRIQNFSLVSYQIHNDTTVQYLKKSGDAASNKYMDANEHRLLITESQELLKISFLIKDMKLFPNETKETIILFYLLNMLAMDKRYFNIDGHQCFLNEAIEIKESKDDGWCTLSGDQKLTFRDNFRIFASFKEPKLPKYYVYVNQTETLYGTGYYYLTVLYVKKPDSGSATTKKPLLIEKSDLMHNVVFDASFHQIISDDQIYATKRELSPHLNLLHLADVTDIVLDNNSTSVASSKLLHVCNRRPKIRVECKNYATVRLRLCELKSMPDRSFCSPALNKCYFLDEYEYDPIMPSEYIRVCKSNDFHQEPGFSLNLKTDLNKTISGWISFLSIVISLIFMFLTLFTYFIFKQMRNLPGWNIINVTLALTLAQFCFLLGSFLNLFPLLCFILSILTHYGFLASFFWMNVIAFDLYRNFCNKSSLILIQTIRLKERLPKYSLYAWIIPLVIIISGLIVDLSVNSSSAYRPCYAGYLNGCSFESETYLVNYNQSLANQTARDNFFNETSCEKERAKNLTVFIVNGPCWIRNGRANLIYFGLPIGIIILVNGYFYFLTIYNIRKKKQEQRKKLRRMSNVKLPGDEDVKFYIQIACIMGFTWIIGFFLTSTSPDSQSSVFIRILFNVLTYLFILLNASTGVFIFFAFLFRKDVINLYKKYFSNKFLSERKESKSSISFIGRFRDKQMSRMRENSSSSTSILDFS
ncbi:EGF-like module-containing mucin-like hormone receptor-like, partial [Brachionus plicatilis]